MNARNLTVLSLAAIVLMVVFAACVNPRKGYRPIQPIAFSHQLHAGTNQIPCQYCHVSPGEGPNSSVPGLNTCMNCHSQVAVQRPEIQKIHNAWKSPLMPSSERSKVRPASSDTWAEPEST